MQAYPDTKEKNERSSHLTLETPDLFLLNSEKCLHKVKALEIRSRPGVLKGKVAHVSRSQHEFLPDVFLHAEVSTPRRRSGPTQTGFLVLMDARQGGKAGRKTTA